MMADRDFLDKLARRLVDEGKLIAAGWVMFRKAVIRPGAPAQQLEDMRLAFFAGAQHLFGSINAIMTEDKEPTEADLNRMSLIDQELQTFIEQFKEGLARAGVPHKSSSPGDGSKP
jgi:hypothetical protein